MEVVVIAHHRHRKVEDPERLLIHLLPVGESIPVVAAAAARRILRIGRAAEHIFAAGEIRQQHFADRRSGRRVLRSPAGRQAEAVRLPIHFQPGSDLFEVAETTGAAGRLPCAARRRNEQTREKGDNSDRNQEFHQRERVLLHGSSSISFQILKVGPSCSRSCGESRLVAVLIARSKEARPPSLLISSASAFRCCSRGRRRK